ncbi:MAG TPA: dihydrofolate reductase family protein [Steroidobacteraceae bacterium]|nr:dihydrofolate reductase family protein [Steroidobacteraceae bacterium]
MRELSADLFVSIDGCASGADEPAYFGCNGPELGTWVRSELARPQVILMGRVTYEALSSIATSPSADKDTLGMTNVPKLVYSNTLREPLRWNNTRLLNGELGATISSLKKESGDPIRCFGSITLVKGLIDFGLLDRLRLLLFPVVLGEKGREPVFEGHRRRELKFVGSRTLDSRLVLLEYRP